MSEDKLKSALSDIDDDVKRSGSRCFADLMIDARVAESNFEDVLIAAGLTDWDTLGCDGYDQSLEVYKVQDDNRLTPEGVDAILGLGFAKIYVNHRDGWETHYSGDNRSGWRRRKTEKGFEMSHWPEGWGDPETGRNAEWLKTGYATIVPEQKP